MQLVRAPGVGKERSEVPGTEAGIQHRQPGLSFGVEAPRRDPREESCTSLLAVLAVDVQQQVYAGLAHAHTVGRCRTSVLTGVKNGMERPLLA